MNAAVRWHSRSWSGLAGSVSCGRLARQLRAFGRRLVLLPATVLARIEATEGQTLARQRCACLGRARLEEVRHGSAHRDLGAALSYAHVQVQIPVG